MSIIRVSGTGSGGGVPGGANSVISNSTDPSASTEVEAENVISRHIASSAIVEPTKPLYVRDRPFRIKLRGSVLALVRLPNRRSVRSAIHQLSISGGVIHLDKPLDEKLEVELIFHIREATIRSKAQMLFPMWATQGWMQPFRFINLAEESRIILEEKLQSFLSETGKAASAGTS